MSTQRVDAATVVARLVAARAADRSGLAFDADGTLWSGDVGEDVFTFACEEGALREAGRDHLERVARAHSLPVTGSTSALGRRIFDAYRRGEVEELLTCEVMTWAYAGLTTEDLVELARRALTARGLVERVRRSLLGPVFEHARREGLHTIVVSASPRPIVLEALRLGELEVGDVAAAVPRSVAGRIAPEMEGRVPYGPEKPVVGRRLFDDRDWLGSFGDNAFDVEMLRAARIGVAVCPKPALAARLGELTNTVILE